MVYDFVPGQQIVVNFETYDVLGMDTATSRALKTI